LALAGFSLDRVVAIHGIVLTELGLLLFDCHRIMAHQLSKHGLPSESK